MVSFSGIFERRARALLLLAPLLAPLPARAEIEPGDLTLTVTAELNGNSAPFSREMVLLKIHGVYKQPILLEEVVQPSLANFSWTQLGRDHWSKTKLPDGQSAIAFDRTVAVFPHHAGQFTIEPFTHKLTVNDVGERRVVEVRSKPIPFPVAQWTEPSGGPDAKEPWWLPAKDVAITDSWSPDPETIKVGETTRRIVTLEAQGMVAEGLPPRPVMRTRGIITFAGPVTRETLLTPSGPVARATYQWDVKPGVPEIIPLDAIAIPWFDTNTRTMRETEIPARQIGGGLPDRETDRAPRDPLAARGRRVGAGRLRAGLGADRLRPGPALLAPVPPDPARAAGGGPFRRSRRVPRGPGHGDAGSAGSGSHLAGAARSCRILRGSRPVGVRRLGRAGPGPEGIGQRPVPVRTGRRRGPGTGPARPSTVRPAD